MKNSILSCLSSQLSSQLLSGSSMLSLLILTSSCGFQQSDEDILGSAIDSYRHILARYEELEDVCDEAAVIDTIRLIGADNRLSFGSSLWQSFVGNDHLTTSRGTPLHRAIYFIESDIDQLEHHTRQLERRLLDRKPVYEQINVLRRQLYSIKRIVQASKAFIEEAQFIEQQRVQKNQLYEQQKQTSLLEDIAQKPTYVEERVIERVIEKPIRVKKEIHIYH